MASKLRPRRCGFEQFSSSSGVDSLQSKGVFSALVRATATKPCACLASPALRSHFVWHCLLRTAGCRGRILALRVCRPLATRVSWLVGGGAALTRWLCWLACLTRDGALCWLHYQQLPMCPLVRHRPHKPPCTWLRKLLQWQQAQEATRAWACAVWLRKLARGQHHHRP